MFFRLVATENVPTWSPVRFQSEAFEAPLSVLTLAPDGYENSEGGRKQKRSNVIGNGHNHGEHEEAAVQVLRVTIEGDDCGLVNTKLVASSEVSA